MPNDRDFDVILWGATGFTGRLVAEKLMQRARGARVALAGRNRQKLEKLCRELGNPELPRLVGDRADRAFLEQLAGRTRVVCTTVGPYARHGNDLVEACAGAGTSYCDLSGEVHWIRHMIDAHAGAARRSGARIVHACGFDSIPADLGVFYLQHVARTELGGPCEHVRARVRDMRGGISGGTVASLEGLLAEARRHARVRRLLLDPYGLNPEGQHTGPDRNDVMRPVLDPDLGWTAPFIMAGANTRIVRRSNAIMGYPYGRDFRYEEALATGAGPRGLLAATATTAATAGLVLSLALPGGPRLMSRFKPQPGEGPSEAQRMSGRFTYDFLGTRATTRVRAWVSARVDPGYEGTSRMLAESALCLAQDADELPVQGGSWTSAAAMGMHLVDRLQQVGINFRAELLP